MPSYLPDCNRDGAWQLVLPNGSGKTGQLRIQSGASPKVQVVTAGFGAQIVAADGTTVLLDVSESGGVTPTVMVIPSKAPPSPGDPAQFFRDSNDSNTLKYFDGTTVFGVGLVQ